MLTRVVLLCLVCLASSGFGNDSLEASDDIRKDLEPARLTIAMWDFSWLYCHYPGGAFEDYDKVTDELLQRGFNTVRIDAFPMVIDQLISDKQEKFKVPADPLRNWGPSEKEWEHNAIAELIDFMTITKAKGISVILSSWGKGDRKRYSNRKRFWKAWETVLDILQEKGLLDHVLYVDFDQEFPYFSPFAAELKRLSKKRPKKTANLPNAMQQAGAGTGAWNHAQREFVKEYFETTLAHFHEKYPGVRFTFSLTSFWREVRSIKPAGLDVLELHIWIKGQLNEYTGFNKLKKNRDPANDYKSYMAGICEAMKHQDALRKHMRQQLDTARSWAKELRVPLTTTEAWGPWWHMDHPDLQWPWLYDWCEYCIGLSSEYGFWGSTPWNYSHPYWKNWANIEWYRKVNTRFLQR
ncbi:MAG: cellulase-like family protein [Planctomycetota bacterium]|nr:cellulase-like family protein [Planctomycetota bacterium]